MEQTPIQSLNALQQRISKKQAANLQIFQKEILQQLRAIKASLQTQSQGANNAANKQESQKKDNLIAQLQKQNQRLAYRITHLARNLSQALSK